VQAGHRPGELRHIGRLRPRREVVAPG